LKQERNALGPSNFERNYEESWKTIIEIWWLVGVLRKPSFKAIIEAIWRVE